MITAITIKNFKALENFHVQELPRIVCLIGLNGAGKSSFLQALDFVSSSFSGSDHFRDWKAADILNAKTKKKFPVEFSFELRLADGKTVTWSGIFSVNEWRFARESVTDGSGAELLAYNGKTLTLGNSQTAIDVSDSAHKGSVFSTRKFDAYPELREIKETIAGLKSLELLSPEELRRGSRTVSEISLGGSGLPGYVRSLERQGHGPELVAMLQQFYPHLQAIVEKKPGPGWFGFAVKELYETECSTGMKHVNDGFLRILAIVSQKFSGKRTLLLDEVENGINQELVERLVELLVTDFADKQIFITTHSSLLLNYFNDELVRDGLVFLYRTKAGGVEGRKFFGLPGMSEKLSYLNAGQVMADTDLVELSRQLSE